MTQFSQFLPFLKSCNKNVLWTLRLLACVGICAGVSYLMQPSQSTWPVFSLMVLSEMKAGNSVSHGTCMLRPILWAGEETKIKHIRLLEHSKMHRVLEWRCRRAIDASIAWTLLPPRGLQQWRRRADTLLQFLETLVKQHFNYLDLRVFFLYIYIYVEFLFL